jgi:CDP-diacylglycerol pyrophosphatase
MCGCPADFVAGLAMPRSRVSGIEDPRRPDAVWPFAWDVALRRIAQPDEIALVINPQNARTQNELHVHILRLREDARRAIEAATPGEGGKIALPGLSETIALDLPNLDGVFSAAAKRLGDERVGDSGILVAKRAGGGYRALLTSSYSPQAFTQNRCSGETPAH